MHYLVKFEISVAEEGVVPIMQYYPSNYSYADKLVEGAELTDDEICCVSAHDLKHMCYDCDTLLGAISVLNMLSLTYSVKIISVIKLNGD